jgi:hypothetical protein
VRDLLVAGSSPLIATILQNIRNKQTILKLYDNLLPALAKHINQELSPVIPLFNDYNLERVVDTWTKDPQVYYPEALSIENGNIEYLGLQLRLEGFLQPGIPPFDLYKEVLLKLDRAQYGLGEGRNSIWVEKTYEETWTEAELKQVAERWCAGLIEDLTQRLQRLA